MDTLQSTAREEKMKWISKRWEQVSEEPVQEGFEPYFEEAENIEQPIEAQEQQDSDLPNDEFDQDKIEGESQDEDLAKLDWIF